MEPRKPERGIICITNIECQALKKKFKENRVQMP